MVTIERQTSIREVPAVTWTIGNVAMGTSTNTVQSANRNIVMETSPESGAPMMTTAPPPLEALDSQTSMLGGPSPLPPIKHTVGGDTTRIDLEQKRTTTTPLDKDMVALEKGFIK